MAAVIPARIYDATDIADAAVRGRAFDVRIASIPVPYFATGYRFIKAALISISRTGATMSG